MIGLEKTSHFQEKIERQAGKILSFFVTVKKKRESVKEKLAKGEIRIVKILDRKLLGEELFTVPNMFSLSRILFGLILWPMIVFEVPTWIIVSVFSLALLTDWLDGAWARKEGDTIIGTILDPWCDKFLFVCCAAALYPLIEPLIFWTVVILEVILFSFSLLGIISVQKGKIGPDLGLRSNFFGKVKFGLEGLTLFLLFLQQIVVAQYCLVGAIFFAVGSAVGKILARLRN